MKHHNRLAAGALVLGEMLLLLGLILTAPSALADYIVSGSATVPLCVVGTDTQSFGPAAVPNKSVPRRLRWASRALISPTRPLQLLLWTKRSRC